MKVSSAKCINLLYDDDNEEKEEKVKEKDFFFNAIYKFTFPFSHFMGRQVMIRNKRKKLKLYHAFVSVDTECNAPLC